MVSVSKVKVIANPAAGRDEAVLGTLNEVFGDASVSWDVSVTNAPGDARRLAERALSEGWDVIAAYGGDGTVVEVAAALIAGEIPLAILPGGTGNAVAADLGVPRTLKEAAESIVASPVNVRQVDVGMAGDAPFMLHAAMGFEVAMLEAATPQAKAQYGVFAYLMSGMQTMLDPPIASYRLTIDGEDVECRGTTCIVANSGSTGVGTTRLAPDIRMDDGLLDVLVFQSADLKGVIGAARQLIGGAKASTVSRWSGRSVLVESQPAQRVMLDGEPMGMTPIEARVVPRALSVVVP